MRTILLVMVGWALWATSARAQYPPDLEAELYRLPDVIFQRVATPMGFKAAYELRIRQPLDHSDPEAGYFEQWVWLSHRGFAVPTVMVAEGYACAENAISEPTDLIGANQVVVEHRFFGRSCPADTLPWQYLDTEQAAADLHRVRELLGRLYHRRPWLCTGISKGGQAALYYRYFYPDDVAVTLPYAAPLMRSTDDRRIPDYLEQAGGAACVAAVEAFQVRILEERQAVLRALGWYALGSGLTFEQIGGLEVALEYAVLEYPMQLWQWHADCALVPEPGDLDADIRHLLAIVDLSLWSDEGIDRYRPHYYQAATEVGYYHYRTDKIATLLTHLSGSPSAALPSILPESTCYRPRLTRKVTRWLRKHGHRIVYLYGEHDPWSAVGVPPSSRVDALWYQIPDAHHGTARIKSLPEIDQQKLLAQVMYWVDRAEEP